MQQHCGVGIKLKFCNESRRVKDSVNPLVYTVGEATTDLSGCQ